MGGVRLTHFSSPSPVQMVTFGTRDTHLTRTRALEVLLWVRVWASQLLAPEVHTHDMSHLPTYLPTYLPAVSTHVKVRPRRSL